MTPHLPKWLQLKKTDKLCVEELAEKLERAHAAGRVYIVATHVTFSPEVESLQTRWLSDVTPLYKLAGDERLGT